MEDENGEVLRLEASNILITTGSQTAIPPIPGIDTPGVVTGDELLNLNENIKSLTIIGGGVIGCEFASLFSSLGTKVVIIEAMGRLLPNMDREIAQNFKMILKRTGDVDVHTNSAVTKIEKSSDGARCLFNEKNSHQEKELTSYMILVVVSRKPYTDGLLPPNTSGGAPYIISEVIGAMDHKLDQL